MPFYKYMEPKSFAQGDIFRNIPYLSFDVLNSLNSKPKDMSVNETKEIIKKICQNGGSLLVKTFISSTFCILITQDCDIVNEKENSDSYYTFLPLEPLPEAKSYPYEKIDKIIRGENFNCYLPEIEYSHKTYGPFKIRFEFPINISKLIIEPYLMDNWIARIPFFTKHLLTSKYSQYFIRPAIDEVIYMNVVQIDKKIQNIWNNSEWTEGEKINALKNYQDALNYANRTEEINSIVWISIRDVLSLLKQIKSKLLSLKDEKYGPIIELCKEGEKSDEIRKKVDNFISIVDAIYKNNTVYNEDLIKNYDIEDINERDFQNRTDEEKLALNLAFFGKIKEKCLELYRKLKEPII